MFVMAGELCVQNPLFAVMAVLSLALGIGANTAIYSVMDAIMLRALPVRNPGELVILNWRAKQESAVVHSHNGTNYDAPGGGVRESRFPVAGLRSFSRLTKTSSPRFSLIRMEDS